LKIVQSKKRSSKLGKEHKGVAALILQSYALKIVQTKKRSSKLGKEHKGVATLIL
jgi:hypothetical protein